MIAFLFALAGWICLALIVTTILHACVVAAVVNLRGAEQEQQKASAPPAQGGAAPITWFRPLKPGVPNLEQKLTTFLAGLRPEDQVIFGVDPGTAEHQVCASLCERRGFACRAAVISCVPGAAQNPKISKLIQMAPHAEHEDWVVMDAEAKADAAFCEAFRSEWHGADAITAGYWIEAATHPPQRLDALSVLMTLWPGLELIRTFGSFRFTLGACTGVRRADLEPLGGFASFGDLLAEDNELGRRLTDSGKTVHLSQVRLALDSDPMSWLDYWEHQVRVAVTYRAAEPRGAAGLILTRGISAGLFLLLLDPSPASLLFLLAAYGARVALAFRMSRHLGLENPDLHWTVPVADITETAAWLVNWFTRSVRWAGQQRPITFRGRFV